MNQAEMLNKEKQTSEETTKQLNKLIGNLETKTSMPEVHFSEKIEELKGDEWSKRKDECEDK